MYASAQEPMVVVANVVSVTGWWQRVAVLRPGTINIGTWPMYIIFQMTM